MEFLKKKKNQFDSEESSFKHARLCAFVCVCISCVCLVFGSVACTLMVKYFSRLRQNILGLQVR
jgi:hypothetical protein